MGLLIAAIPGFVPRDKGAITLDLATRRMIEGLRKVQSVAMVQNRDQLFSLDVERRQFLPGEGAIPIQVDRSIDLRFVTARKERIGSSIGQIRFFADGSSTGGRIVLEQGGQLSVIEVDWLTLLPRRACCHG